MASEEADGAAKADFQTPSSAEAAAAGELLRVPLKDAAVMRL